MNRDHKLVNQIPLNIAGLYFAQSRQARKEKQNILVKIRGLKISFASFATLREMPLALVVYFFHIWLEALSR